MAENFSAIVGIELLVAAQGCDLSGTLKSSVALELVRSMLRERVPVLTDDRYLHPDMASAIDLVRNGAVIRAASAVPLPGLTAW